MRKELIAAIAALAVSASAASANVLKITDILDGSTGGFGYSVFHSQTSKMNGATLEDPDVLSPGGTWNTVTGAISFAFSLVGGGTVSAVGNLMTGAGTYNGGQYKAVSGSIDMTFSGATNIWNGTHTFIFTLGSQSGSNFPANGVFYPSFAQLNLWGDNGNYGMSGTNCGAAGTAADCVGVDLGLALAPVPVPAAGFLLLGALGGLGFATRRKRKAA